MTTGSRPRFSVRVGLLAAPEHDGPFDDVPEHLLAPLQQWVAKALREEDAMSICLRLRIPALKDPGQRDRRYVLPLTQTAGAQLLDVVDEVLRTQATDDWPWAMLLRPILDDGGSAYRVNEAEDGLEERVTPAARDAVLQTIADAATGSAVGSAADHLAAAWQAAYGRNPDAVRAYSEAIKAVECAAQAVIQPNHAKATLGSMLGEIKGARHKFSTVINSPAGDPMAPVEAMMRTLWEGQTSRHGAQTATVLEPLDAARAGVHLAAALVQWFVSGAVTRSP